METDLNKVPELKNSEERVCFRVLFSDIDMNRHVSSAKYLQWITDSCPSDFLAEKCLRSVEISYLAEALLGDEVTICFEPSEERELCSIGRAADGKELCRAKIRWNGENETESR